MSIFSEDKQYIAGTYNRFPVNIQSGKGSIAIADDGKKYIDFASGIAVNSFGFCDNEWVQAVTNKSTAYNTLQTCILPLLALSLQSFWWKKQA